MQLNQGSSDDNMSANLIFIYVHNEFRFGGSIHAPDPLDPQIIRMSYEDNNWNGIIFPPTFAVLLRSVIFSRTLWERCRCRQCVTAPLQVLSECLISQSPRQYGLKLRPYLPSFNEYCVSNVVFVWCPVPEFQKEGISKIGYVRTSKSTVFLRFL